MQSHPFVTKHLPQGSRICIIGGGTTGVLAAKNAIEQAPHMQISSYYILSLREINLPRNLGV